MQLSQYENKREIIRSASPRQRLAAGLVFLSTMGFFALLLLAAHNKIDVNRWLTPCGFKQRYGLPCPTCGVTTSLLAFGKGKILESFYIQPVGALLGSILALSAPLTFITAVFGVYFGFIERFWARVRAKYVILVLIIVILAGWAVTLARAIST